MEFGFDFEERRQLGYKVIDRVNEYFDSLPNRPVQLPSHQRTFSELDENPGAGEDALALSTKPVQS
jgi:hypothetical protein